MGSIPSLDRYKLYVKAVPLFKKNKSSVFIGNKLGISRQTVSTWKRKWIKSVNEKAESNHIDIEPIKIKKKKVVESMEAEIIYADSDSDKAIKSVEINIPVVLELTTRKILDVLSGEKKLAGETNLTKLAALFNTLAPYVVKKIDGESGNEGIKNHNFYVTLLKKINLELDGHPERITNTRNQEKPTTGS